MTAGGEADRAVRERSEAVDHSVRLLTLPLFRQLHAAMGSSESSMLDDDKLYE